MFRFFLVLVTVVEKKMFKLIHFKMLSINVKNKHSVLYSRFLLPLLLETQRHFETM